MGPRVRAIVLALVVCVSTFGLSAAAADAKVLPTGPSGSTHAGATLTPARSVVTSVAFPAWSHPAMPHPAFAGSVTVILPDGSMSGASAPITASGNTYTITGAFTGGLVDERNGSTVVGANKQITMASGLTWTVAVWGAHTVSLTGINITSTDLGLYVLESQDVSFTGGTIASGNDAAEVYNSNDVTFSGNHAPNTDGVYAEGVTGLFVNNNNLSGTIDEALYGYYVSDVQFDHNMADNSYSGPYLEYGSQAMILGNNFTGDEYAVYGYFFSQVTADWNNASFVTDYFYLEYGTGVTADNNAGQNASSNIFYAYSYSNVVIANDRWPGGLSDGIYIEYSNNIAIDNVDLVWGEQAAYFYEGSNVSATNVQANHSYYGFELYDFTHATFNDIGVGHIRESNGEAFYTDDDANVSVSNSWLGYSPYGEEDYYSSSLVFTNDNFSFATGFDDAFYGYEDGPISVTGSAFFNDSGDGFYGYFVNGVTLTNDNFEWTGAEAVYIDYGTDVTVLNTNSQHSVEDGIYLYAVSGATIENNLGGLDNNVYKYGIGFGGEYLFDATIWNNSFLDTNYSLYLEDSTDVWALDNNASNSYYGLYSDYNSNVTFAGNQVYHDNNSFYIDENLGVWFYHNNFVADAGWENYVLDLDLVTWADGYPGGGNYWSNHTSPDTMSGPGQNLTGSDGIVDTPFVINATMSDPYPLTHVWTAPTVGFSESGLTVGTLWWVTVNGATWSSTTSKVSFTVPDAASTASYGYTIPKVAGYGTASPASGTVSAATGTVPITFTPSPFTVTFTETGLASGTAWSVTLDGKTLTSGSGGTVVGTAINGSHTFSVAAVTHYAITANASGSFTVSGNPPTINVVFVQTASSGTTGNGGGGSSSSNNGNSYSNTEFYALLGLLILFIVLTIVALMRGRGGSPSNAAAQPWTPPASGAGAGSPPPSGGGSPPPGATGGSPPPSG